MTRTKHARAFTLVELLVVITIIGILIGLLMPAVQQAREAGRRTQCKNHLSNIGKGVASHVSKYGWYPTGGWGWGYAGDPDAGYTSKQPAGWCYNILPFIEQDALHDMGKGKSDAEKRNLGRQATETPVSIYVCPTRRKPVTYPYVHGSPYTNIDRPTVIARGDYAMNAGSVHVPWEKGKSESLGDGVSYALSEVSVIGDGTSNTYLVGERYANPDHYFTGSPSSDDQGWNLGFDHDIYRWTSTKPVQDRQGYTNDPAFGSAHAAGWHMVFCDGAVRMLSYGIDEDTHRNLGSCNDHIPIDQSKLPAP